MDGKSEDKSKLEHLEGDLTKLGSTKEESELKTKEEDFLQIKHEVDSDDDQNEDQWEAEEFEVGANRKLKETSGIMRVLCGEEDENYDGNYDDIAIIKVRF